MKYLIAGLGNIGAEYENTRHNIGFGVADALAQKTEVAFEVERYASIIKFRLKGRQVYIIKPNTYMNLSGKAVRYWLNKLSIPLENFVCIVDDIALPIGKLRLKTEGGDGGHNGLASIIECLDTKKFARLRFGVGNNFPKGHQIDYVLGQWQEEEKECIEKSIQKAVKLIHSYILIGPERTMNFFN